MSLLLVAVTMFIGIFTWWAMFHERVSHEGRVCSGDYLAWKASTDGYLKDTGDFIIYFLYVMKVILTFYVCYAYYFIFAHDQLGEAFG